MNLPHRLALVVLVVVVPAPADEPVDTGADLAQYDALIKPTDRAHWSFQPLRAVSPPAVKHADWVRTPIDAFVLAKLESRGWSPSPPAESHALLRRVYLDLIGLPPTPAEQDAFARDPSPHALDRVIDDLLARPSYGERWGRHWLDLVRYAETNGYERDAIKPHVWRYRDYVIRSFNDDKPYDRFLLEQLAGDELPDSSADSLVATGFHRLGHWDDEPADPKEDRFDQLDDIVSTATQVFLGLTIGCARCHNHKFEPLTMHDYYRLVAVFSPLARPRNGRTELDLPIGTRAELDALAIQNEQIATLERELNDLRESARADFLSTGQSRLPAEVIDAFRRKPDDRTEEQRKLVREHAGKLDDELAATLPDEMKKKIAEAAERIRRLTEMRSDLPRGYFMHEPSHELSVTHLLLRGKATRPGPAVEPGAPAVLAPVQPTFVPGQRTSGRRLALARWMLEPHPGAQALTARVIVNRVWQFHFGEGLVRTSSDFGLAGQRPTHPELLDWLANSFVREGFSIKKLHRLIMASNAYRMTKRWNAEYAAQDPENELLWRMHYRRLEVEPIRDSMLAVSGQINRQMFGPSMYPHVPKEALEGHSDPDKIWKPFDERDASRRTVYAFVKRSMIVPMLEVLDLCDTTRSSAQRAVTTVAPQALTLFNSEFVNRQARSFAQRLIAEVGNDPVQQIERAYRLALCRPPTATEQTTLLKFLEAESKARERDAQTEPAPGDTSAIAALDELCRAILNLNEFVYPD